MANAKHNALTCPKCKKIYYGPLELENGELCCPLCGENIVPDFKVTARSDEEFRLAETCYLSYLERYAMDSDSNELNILLDRACGLYRKAAFAGHPEAIVRLGYFYDKGYLKYGGKINNQNVALNFYKKVIGNYAETIKTTDDAYRTYMDYLEKQSNSRPELVDKILKAYIDYAMGLSNDDSQKRFGLTLRDDTGRVGENVKRTLLATLKQKVLDIRTQTAWYVYDMSHFLLNERILPKEMQECVNNILNNNALDYTKYKNESEEDALSFFKSLPFAYNNPKKGEEQDVLANDESNPPLFGFLRISAKLALENEEEYGFKKYWLSNKIKVNVYFAAKPNINNFKNLLSVTEVANPDDEVLLYFYNRSCERYINGKKLKTSNFEKKLLLPKMENGALVVNDSIYSYYERTRSRLKPGVAFYTDDLYYAKIKHGE